MHGIHELMYIYFQKITYRTQTCGFCVRMSILHISLKLKVQKNAVKYGNQIYSLYRSADMFSWSRAACEPQCCVYSSVCLKQIITIGLPSATVPIPLLDCIEPQMTRCFITIMELELSSIGRCVSLGWLLSWQRVVWLPSLIRSMGR